MKKIVRIPGSLDDRKKTWRKLLTQVDKTKANGYAFIGNWLRAGERAELEVGSFVLCYDEPGSAKNWYPVVRLFKIVENENGLEEVYRWKGDTRERSWALAVRDEIAAILAEAQGQEPQEGNMLEQRLSGISDEELINVIRLSGISDKELIAELKRRGYTVTQ
jgi:hypothetical protein